jgi:hypothetical protein
MVGTKRRYGGKPYMRSVSSGVLQYLRETPWAVTVQEIVSSGKNNFLDVFFKDANERMRGKNITIQITNIIQNKIIYREIKELRINQTSIIKAGEINFRNALSPSDWKRNALDTDFVLLTRNKKEKMKIGKEEVTINETEEKVIVRVLLEYWDICKKRKLKETATWFKVLFYLGNTGPLTERELNFLINGKEKSNSEKNKKELHKELDRPEFIRRVKAEKGKDTMHDTYMLTPFFQIIWNTAMHDDTLERWKNWEKIIKIQRDWV